MSLIVKSIALPGAALGTLATLAGLLADPLPPFELVNHFRPWLMAGCLALLLLALALRTRLLAGVMAALAGLNGALMVAPLSATASTAPGSHTVKIVTFNVWGHNRTPRRVADFLAAEAADIVVLQEMSASHRRTLLPRLRETYPYIYTCNCRAQVLLSRHPWLAAGGQHNSQEHPGLVWARFAYDDGRTFRIIAMHPAYPFRPWQQARHYDWLNRAIPALAGDRSEPLIIAGDFNMSPWSLRMQRLLSAAGLRRHGTWSLSWPAHLKVPLQAVLIDNLLSTPDVTSISFRTGPSLGSDHLPVIARVGLP